MRQATVLGFAVLGLMRTPSLAGEAELPPGPRAFGMLLARHGVPAGIVASASALEAHGPIPSGDASLDERARFRDELLSQLERFNAAGGAFRAELEDGVVHMHGVDEPAALAGRVREAAVDVPALAAIVHHVAPAMSGIAPGGVAGVGLQPGPGCPVSSPVRFPAGITARDALDAVVKQVPGLAWVVSYGPGAPAKDLKAGLLCGDGYYGRVTVFP